GKIVHRIASEVSKRHQLRHSFSFVMYNVNDIGSNEIDFISEAVKDGIGLWIRPDVGVLAKPQSTLRPKTIVSYSLRGLSQKEKMAVHRALYGYRVVKRVGDKEYVNESLGLIEGIGEKLGSGLVMVDMNRAEEVTRVLDECGAEFELRDVWV
ncbi:MAG: hypothetical protein KAW09_01900, partial [Thermoplasmata archaeon]|nr:hypothetical protein [Thermoplasmata archaeon]